MTKIQVCSYLLELYGCIPLKNLQGAGGRDLLIVVLFFYIFIDNFISSFIATT